MSAAGSGTASCLSPNTRTCPFRNLQSLNITLNGYRATSRRCSAAASSSGGSGSSAEPAMHAGAPWSISPYYTKKLTRQTDALGNIISEPDAVAAAPGWTPDAQLRLAAAALAPELQRDAEELLDKVRQLLGLLPHMASLRSLKPAELVRMAAAVEQITARLVALRRRFPGADVAAMVAAHPPLLRMDEAEVEAAVAAVRHAFPEASQEDLEAMLSANAGLLDGGGAAEACLAGVGHLLPRDLIIHFLKTDPAFLYQFQPLEGQSRGERDSEYLADMLRGS